MTFIDPSWRVVLIALAATLCAVGVVRAEAQVQVVAQPPALGATTAGIE